MIVKSIEPDMQFRPGDIMLGLLSLAHSTSQTRSLGIVSAINDNGPSEIMILNSHKKTNRIFSQEIVSFVDILENEKEQNRFFIFKAVPREIIQDHLPAMRIDSLIPGGGYVAFWGYEIPAVLTKTTMGIRLRDKTNDNAGYFTAVDVVREQWMYEMTMSMRHKGLMS